MFTDELTAQATRLLKSCNEKGLTIATAESCTGGLISALLTDISGSSSVFMRGYVTYSNLSKTEMLGVDAEMIDTYGAVSEQVATAMAQGALTRAKTDIAVAVTGIAGPGGGSLQKPVGLVYIAVATHNGITVEENHFSGDRKYIRLDSVAKALQMIEASLSRSFVYVA